MTHSDSLVDAVAKIIREAHGEKTDRELAGATIAAVRRLDAALTALGAWVWIEAPAPGVAELIRLAPEMEAWMRQHSTVGVTSYGTSSCAQCFSEVPSTVAHCSQVDTCDLARILAALDAARKEPA